MLCIMHTYMYYERMLLVKKPKERGNEKRCKAAKQESIQSAGQVLGDCQGCNTHKRQVLECIDCLCPLSAFRCPARICSGNTPFSPRETHEILNPRENVISWLLSDYPSFPDTRPPSFNHHARFAIQLLLSLRFVSECPSVCASVCVRVL